MPRPKRTKVAPSAPTSRVASTAATSNPQSQQRNTSNQPTGRVATTSDDSEGIVTTSATLRNRRGVEKRNVFMSGGLGTGDAQDAHRTPGVTRRKPAAVDTARAREQAKAIEGLKKRREAALAKQKVSVVEVPSSIPVAGSEDEGLPTTAGKGAEAVRTVGSVSPGTGSRSQGTPGAEVSILALANFKRRPRQPSILQAVQKDASKVFDDLYDASDAEEGDNHAVDHIGQSRAEDETESRAQGTPGAEGSILALANFKRRPRQPSILEVAIQQGVGNVDDDCYEDDDNVDRIGAFQPEDESTPLIASKTRPQTEAVLSPSLPSPTPESLPRSSSKKRKLTPVEVQVPRSSSPEARSPPSAQRQNNEDHTSRLPHDDDDQANPPEQPEAHFDHEPTPQIWSDTLAPPLSSSPCEPTPHTPPRLKHSAGPTTAQAKSKQPARNNHPRKSHEFPTKRSNAPPKTRTRTRQPLSTATLQSLLPRRRIRARPSTFDIPSSDGVDIDEADTTSLIDDDHNDDDDDDELARPPAKKAGVSKRAANTASATAAAGVNKKPPPGKRQRATAAAAAGSKGAKNSAANAKKAAGGGGGAGVGVDAPSTKPRRTYTRRLPPSEKTNDQDPGKGKENTDPYLPDDAPADEVDTSSSQLESGGGGGRLKIGGPELKRVARWFREVDRWQLDFEEVTASSDSMRDAR